jgi:Xaa-Pro aminopeptidase
MIANLKERRRKLFYSMDDKSVMVLFSGVAPYKSRDEKYQFTPNKNFLYLTGLDKEKMILVVQKNGEKITETLYIEKDDPQLAKWMGHKMSVEEAKEISGIEDIKYYENFENDLGRIMSQKYEKVYLDLEKQGWDDPITTLPLELVKDLRVKYPSIRIKNIYHQIAELRTIKDKKEIENIKRAITITKNGIYNMVKHMKPGMRENEIEAFFDFVLKQNGVKDYAFKTIAASGKNAAILHYEENNAETKDGDMILFDLGAQWNNYSADISRTFPLNGKFSERQKDVYNVVLETMKEVEKNAKPGVSMKELHEISKKKLAEGAIKLGLIDKEEDIFEYYFHSIGHFMGMDTHDVGARDAVLKPGMVITNEPGLYIPEENIGIRIEDDLLITEDGCENLSKDIIKEIDEIENFMK